MNEIEKGREYSRETERVTDDGISKVVKLGSRQSNEWLVRRLEEREEEEREIQYRSDNFITNKTMKRRRRNEMRLEWRVLNSNINMIYWEEEEEERNTWLMYLRRSHTIFSRSKKE